MLPGWRVGIFFYQKASPPFAALRCDIATLNTRLQEARIPATPERSIAMASDTQRTLVRVLDTAFGDDTSARVLLHAALRSARRATLPVEPEAILDFVRAHMMGSLTEELGPRIVSALLDQLTEELRISAPPSTRRRADESARSMPAVTSEVPKSSGVRLRSHVLLIDHDRFARSNLARTLITSACDVAAAETPLDVRAQDSRIDVAIINMEVPEVAAVLGALLSKDPDVRIIAIANDVSSADTLLRAASVRTYRVIPRSMRPPEVVEMIKRISLV